MREEFRAPFRGLDLLSHDTTVAPTAATVLENVSLENGTIKARPGLKLRSHGLGPVTGAIAYRKPDGTQVELYVVRQALVRREADGSLVEIATGFPFETPVDFAVIRGRLYLAADTKWIVTDGDDVYDPELPRPATAPTVALDATSGAARGTIEYVYTYYSSTWGQESQASPTAVSIAVPVDGSQQPELTDWDIASPDARVDKLRIYRRRIDAYEVAFRLVVEIDLPENVGDTVIDVLHDMSLSSFVAPPRVDSETPPMRRIAYQSGIALMVSKEFPDRIYYSLPDQPWVVAGFMTIEGEEGADAEPITALSAWGGVVEVHRRFSTWILTGNTRSSFSRRRSAAAVGAVADRAVVQVGGLEYYLGDDAVYVTDGGLPQRISAEIDPIVRKRNKADDHRVQAFHLHEQRAVFWCIAPQGSTTHTLAIVYWYERSQRVGSPVWSTWHFQRGVSSIARVELESGSKVILGFEDGDIMELDPEALTDNGLPIWCKWRTGFITPADPASAFYWGRGEVHLTPASRGGMCRLSTMRPSDHKPLFQSNLEPIETVVRFAARRQSASLALEFEFEGGRPIEITGFAIEVDVRGRV